MFADDSEPFCGASNYTMLKDLLGGNETERIRDALASKIKGRPETLGHSLTWDHGVEM